MRLIDANAFSEDLKTEALNLWLDGMKGTPRDYRELYDIIDRIGEQPTIDAEPVRHGRWEFYEDWGSGMSRVDPPEPFDAGWKCSSCGIDLGDYLTDCLGVNVYVDEEDKMPKIKSCPHCGAKMDAKEA